MQISRDGEKILFWLLFVATILIGGYGFILSPTTERFDVASHTIGLFFFAWTSDSNDYINIAQLLAIFTTLWGVLIFFAREIINRFMVWIIQKYRYNLVVGVDEQSSILLEKQESTIVIDKDNSHHTIERLKDSHIGVMIGNISKQIKNIKLDSMHHAIISTGNDRENIALSTQIIEASSGKNAQTIHTHIVNRDLNVLFHKKNLLSTKEKDITILTYSLYENMAKKLFEEHHILGYQTDIVQSNQEYSMIVVGSSPLAIEIIYHLAILAHLPNQNHLRLYCVNREAQRFCSKVEMLFSNISKIPHLSLVPIELDYEGIEFYRDKIWKSKSLTNIYLATDNEEHNLDIAINLQDTTYLKAIAQKEFKTKVLFAIYHDLGLSQQIDANQDDFANFYSFANIAKVSTKEILLESKLDYLAQLIHYDSNGNKNKNEERMHQKWLELSQFHRDSGKARALHIETKLLSLGLQRVKSDKSKEILQEENKKIFYNKLIGDSTFNIDMLNFTINDFPKDFDTSMVDKLARAEHNRWDAFHYLNGWSYNSNRNNDAKEHNCLKPIEDFDNDTIKKTYKYDLNSVYYIPLYLAKCGYEVI